MCTVDFMRVAEKVRVFLEADEVVRDICCGDCSICSYTIECRERFEMVRYDGR